MRKNTEKPLELQPKQSVDGAIIRSDFVRTTTKNIAEHSLQLSFCKEGSAEYRYHMDCIKSERASLSSY